MIHAEIVLGDDSSTRGMLLKRFVMLKVSQLSSDDRNDSIPMILISNDQPHVPAAPINVRQRRSVATLIRAAATGDRFFGSRVPSDCALSHLHQMDFIVHKKPLAYDPKPVDRRAQAKICPSIVGSIW